MYQNLVKVMKPESNVGNTDSVHFLMFPEVKKEYFDADIERSVGRMQSVIDLGRGMREKKNLNLKVKKLNQPFLNSYI